MSTMVQIRNVPDELHRELKARAALAGMSLSDYIMSELRRALERPTRQALLQRIQRRKPVRPPVRAADAVRQERERR
jgi:antitoxin FitA